MSLLVFAYKIFFSFLSSPPLGKEALILPASIDLQCLISVCVDFYHWVRRQEVKLLWLLWDLEAWENIYCERKNFFRTIFYSQPTVPPKAILTLMKYDKGDIYFLKAPTNRSMEMGYETSQLVCTLDILTTAQWSKGVTKPVLS